MLSAGKGNLRLICFGYRVNFLIIILDYRSFLKMSTNGKADDDDIANIERMLLAAEEEDEAEKSRKTGTSSVVKTGEGDSSDDEEQRDFQNCKYNDFGREINKKLKEKEETRKYDSIRLFTASDCSPSTSKGFLSSLPPLGSSSNFLTLPKSTSTKSEFAKRLSTTPAEPTVFCDPVFGLRIVQPLISSATLKERMDGRIPVGVQRARFHTERGDLTKDWVIAGVITQKSPVRQTQKGDPFSIWSISDLRGEIKTVSVFLFRSAHKELWKNSVGTVIGILNPKVMERKDDKIEAALSVDNHLLVMILGQSKDLGKCRAKKNNGEPCEALINKTDCDVCIFHMKKEYSKIRRSEFQSAGLGQGLTELRNKVLGKSEVFYAGQSFSALKPAKKTAKMIAQDRDRLMTLSEYFTSPYRAESTTATASPSSSRAPQPVARKPPGAAASLEVNISQRKKDFERLKMLQGTDTPRMIHTPKPQPAPEPPKNDANFVPKLTDANLTFSFSVPVKKSTPIDQAKQRAAAILKKNPLEPNNPNLIKYRGTEAGKKRLADELGTSMENDGSDAKKAKLSEAEEAKRRKEYLTKVMNATSTHANLVEDKDAERRDKCFDAMEKKEAMEDRMANTMEMKVSLNGSR